MDKQRSKTSLGISKPLIDKPKQKYTVIIEVNQKQHQKNPSQIKTQDVSETADIMSENFLENFVEKQNPEYETVQNVTNQAPMKSVNNVKPIQVIPSMKVGNQQAEKQQALTNFQQFFSQRKKYSELAQVNNSFASVIESGKIRISLQKSFLSYKKHKLATQSSLQNLLSQEEQKIQLITQRKQQMLQELNNLYAEQREVRNKKKALILSRKAHHESTTSLRRSIQTDESPIKKFQKSPKNQILKEQSDEQKFSQSSKHFNSRAETKPYEKNYFKHEERKSIARILKQLENKEIQFERKVEKVMEKAEKQKIEKLQLQKQKKEVERQKRRSKVLERLQTSKCQRKSQIREKQIAKTPFKTEPSQGLKENQFFTEVDTSEQKKFQSMPKSLPKRKYIYRQFEKKQAEQQNERKRYQEIVLQKRRQEARVDFEEIKIHLRKYKQIKIKQIELERQKIQSLRSQQKQRLKQIRQKYGFLTKIKQSMLEEQRKSIEMLQSQLNIKTKYQKKMREYFQSVKEKTQTTSMQKRNQNRVKTSTSFEKLENQEANDKKQLQVSKNSTFNKNIRRQNKLKNKTHFLSRKKDSFQSNTRTQFPVENRSKTYTNYLSNMKKDSSKQFERKETAMMNILKNQQASIQDIQKAFGIFKDLNKSFWQSPTRKRGKLIRKQRCLFSSDKVPGQN